MKRISIVTLLLFFTTCFGSEILRKLEDKVMNSDLVVIGSVVDVRLAEIRKLSGLSVKAQDTHIRFLIEECILGKKTGEILIEAHSVSFSDAEGSHGATAGFSNFGVKKGARYIAYLKEANEGYVLAEESNQFLEWIAEGSRTVRDVGQTSRMVPLELKRKQLLELAAKHQEAQQSDAHEPPPRDSVSERSTIRTLDSQPAPVHGGGR
ncbi:MAG TPA: hypothetical protein P5186_24895 [Candidatus Paceibacterota bacterium]|nr:hypothetical protein [Verrucomicrobiota bacterium]HRY51301.1 hypothetical protein [Candidatus Paceibacterota bacterium]